MLPNAREILRQDNRQEVILLAIEGITASKLLEKQAKQAENDINAILETLVGSAERYSGGTAPQKQAKEKSIKRVCGFENAYYLLPYFKLVPDWRR
jgi:hypothetical protein